MRLLVVSCSLSPGSRSRLLARYGQQRLAAAAGNCDFADLRDFALPVCDGADSYEAPGVARIREIVERADGILLAFPVYNYDAGATAKNLIELTGSAWHDKVVGLAGAAGGNASFMATAGLAMSLLLDFRCVIVPRPVVATAAAYEGGSLVDERTINRMNEMTSRLVALTRVQAT